MPNTSCRGLILETCLPLDWQPLAAPLTPEEMGRLERDNLDVLRVVSALETPVGESGEEGNDGNATELARLDFKLNLLLDMVGQLLSRELTLPDTRPLTLTPVELHWRDFDTPPSGGLTQVRLWLTGRYPHPIVLPAIVERVTEVAEGGPTAVTARFQDLGGALRAALERHIFVQHRRHTARRRRRR